MMAAMRLVPGLGTFLEKSGFCVQGDVPRIDSESAWQYLERRFKNTSLNTFDSFGSHSYQHLKSDDAIRALVIAMQPDATKVHNMDKYFLRPPPIGCALRVYR
jgi:hypothetical protein